MSGRVISPFSSNTPMIAPRIRSDDCVTMSSRRRSNRSATHPVTLTRSSGGANCSAIVSPIAPASLSVRTVSTTQLSAVACIQAPTFETRAPMNQTR